MTKDELTQTLVLIKPDALKNSLTGYVLSQLSEFHTGLRFAATKIVQVSRLLAAEHYAEHLGKVFYPSLLEYITGKIHYADAPWKRRVIAIVYQGEEAVTKIRAIAGPTNPLNARDEKPGCVRALGTLAPVKDESGKVVGERMDNLIHASANAEDAEREIKLWFLPTDMPPLMRAYATVVSDAQYYFKDGKLLTKHEPGAAHLVVPGDVVWESDLQALDAIAKGETAACTLETVAAKYLINQNPED